MKVTIKNGRSGDISLDHANWIYLKRAVGSVRIEYQTSDGNSWVASDIYQSQAVRDIPGAIVCNFIGVDQELTIQAGSHDVSISPEATISGVLTEITNPVTVQQIIDPVSVGNFPASFQVSNFPASFQVSNFPASFLVSNLPEVQTVQQKAAGGMVTGEYSVPVSGSVVIPARAGRKRLLIQAESDAETVIKARVSESTAVSIKGVLMAVGAGFVGELEMSHEAEVRVWNPDPESIINVSVLEEY